MTRNLIPEIAKMLGVEIGEEFRARSVNRGITDKRVFILSEDGGFYKDEKTQAYVISPEILGLLICGHFEVVKLPWKPKKMEKCYSLGFSLESIWDTNQRRLIVKPFIWDGQNPVDIALLEKGWVYRTREEAETALPKVAQELGVDYEL